MTHSTWGEQRGCLRFLKSLNLQVTVTRLWGEVGHVYGPKPFQLLLLPRFPQGASISLCEPRGKSRRWVEGNQKCFLHGLRCPHPRDVPVPAALIAPCLASLVSPARCHPGDVTLIPSPWPPAAAQGNY